MGEKGIIKHWLVGERGVFHQEGCSQKTEITLVVAYLCPATLGKGPRLCAFAQHCATIAQWAIFYITFYINESLQVSILNP